MKNIKYLKNLKLMQIIMKFNNKANLKEKGYLKILSSFLIEKSQGF